MTYTATYANPQPASPPTVYSDSGSWLGTALFFSALALVVAALL